MNDWTDEEEWQDAAAAQERREREVAGSDPRLNVALPDAPESEECLLSMLMNSGAEVWQEFAPRLKDHLFWHPARLTMFMLVSELQVSGQELRLPTFTGMLRQRNELDAVGGPAEVSRLWFVFQAPIRGALLQHLAVLEEMHVRRGMIKAAWGIVAGARDTTVPYKAALEKAEGDLFNLHESSSRKGTRLIKEVLPEVVKEIQTAYENRGHIAGGLLLGLTELDQVLNGLKTGLFVVAARPSRGKTVFACQLALNVATGRGQYGEFDQAPVPVLFFSLETTDRALTRRILLNEWTVPISQARNGQMSRNDHDNLTKAVKLLQQAPIYLHESFGMSVQELRATARMVISRLPERTDGKPRCLILVDYLQLVTSSSKAAQYNRQTMISEVSTGLKHMAHEFDVPVLSLAQLNRDGDVERPTLAHLRESGQIEQDADYIGMICDPPEGLTQGEDGEPSEHEYMGFDLCKNKDGPTTTDGTPLAFYFDKSIFRLRSTTNSLSTNDPSKYRAGYEKETMAVKRKQEKEVTAATMTDNRKSVSKGGGRMQWNGTDWVPPGHPSLSGGGAD